MKKATFCTRIKTENGVQAVRKSGWLEYINQDVDPYPVYLYKSDYCGVWYAVDHNTGLSFGHGYIRKAALAAAAENLVKLVEYHDTHPEEFETWINYKLDWRVEVF